MNKNKANRVEEIKVSADVAVSDQLTDGADPKAVVEFARGLAGIYENAPAGEMIAMLQSIIDDLYIDQRAEEDEENFEEEAVAEPVQA